MADRLKRGGVVRVRFFRFMSHFINMKNKIWVSLSLFTLIPFVLASVYIYISVCKTIKQDYVNQVNEELITSVNTINREYMLYVHKSRFIYINSYVISGIHSSLKWDPLNSYDFKSYMESLTRDLDFSDSNTRAFTFYLADYKGNSEYLGNIEELKNRPMVKQILNSPADLEVWNSQIRSDSFNRKYISFYRNITSAIGLSCILEVNIPYDSIVQYLSQLHIPESAVVLHIGASGEIYNAGGDAAADHRIRIDSKPILDGSKITIELPRSVLYHKYAQLLLFIMLILLTLAVMIVFASNFTSKKITGSLGDFMTYIKRNNIRGDYALLDGEFESGKNLDEISVIKQKFINILNTMNATYNDLITTKNQNNELQIKLLHARLNPHLLYNSLSAIKWIALRNKDSKTAEMIDSMTYYYRSTLNEGEEMIKISDEINLIKEYVKIMQYTNSHPYELVVDIDRGMKDQYIPVHLLQPAVENAILHGLRKMPDGRLIIKGYEENGDLIFEVQDNGCGMTEETIEKVLSQRYKKTRGGYGIKNLIQRIQFYYGDSYGIEMKSGVDQGTTVTIKIKASDHEEPMKDL